MSRRKNARVRQLDSSLTGKFGNKIQAIAVRQLRQWIEELPTGDSMSFRCESATSDKQFKVWTKWFQRHEYSGWEINQQFKSFFYYKHKSL